MRISHFCWTLGKVQSSQLFGYNISGFQAEIRPHQISYPLADTRQVVLKRVQCLRVSERRVSANDENVCYDPQTPLIVPPLIVI